MERLGERSQRAMKNLLRLGQECSVGEYNAARPALTSGTRGRQAGRQASVVTFSR